jgi:hypothetical protein
VTKDLQMGAISLYALSCLPFVVFVCNLTQQSAHYRVTIKVPNESNVELQ